LAGTSVKLRCAVCGWRTSRMMGRKGPRPCSKCGGHMTFDGDPDETDRWAVILIIGAILGMLIVTIILTVNDLN
jgi:uncharacterized protein (DUF983 family)